MSSAQPQYGTWHADPKREAAMEEGHRPFWRHFIEAVPETDLSTREVLDFGCNRGGFLRLLYALKPFRHAVGVDIAGESVAVAQAMVGVAPIDYQMSADLAAWPQRFDLAFSYEVIYLLPDLARHAAQIYTALRRDGVYYAVTGCHTASPLWPAWRELIGATTNAPVQDHSPDDYADAFRAAGFDVSVRRFGYDGFVPVTKDQRYYPTLLDAIDYPAEHKLLFRLCKTG